MRPFLVQWRDLHTPDAAVMPCWHRRVPGGPLRGGPLRGGPLRGHFLLAERSARDQRPTCTIPGHAHMRMHAHTALRCRYTGANMQDSATHLPTVRQHGNYIPRQSYQVEMHL